MRFVLFLAVAFLLPLSLFAQDGGGSERTERKFGMAFSFNDPAPALYGLNFYYNFTDYMQMQLGMGFNTEGVGESVTGEISTSMVTAIFFVITLGQIEWEKIRDFVKDEDEAVIKTVFAWGGGFNFFVPGWNLSPMAGIGYGGWEANNSPFGLPNRDRHVYYKLGVDWQTPIAIRLSAGWMHAPDLPPPIADKMFAHLGLTF